MDIDRFKTRAQANSVRNRLFLVDPATLAVTEDWIDVRSDLCDEFRAALDASRATMVEIRAEEDDAKRAALAAEAKITLAVSLVESWSFDAEPTPQAVADLLREAPQVYDAVIVAAGERSRFFAAGSSSSAPGSAPKSN